MYRKGIILLLTVVLAGCWDERLYKNQSVVSLVGVEGQIGDYKAYYAYPKTTGDQTQTTLIEGTGISPRDVRSDANMKVEQTLDLSELSTLLISDVTAKERLYDVLDIYFRDPKNPISIKVALTEGDVKPFISMMQQLADSAGVYYQRFIEGTEEITVFPKQDLQEICALLFDDAIDVALPYIKLDEEGKMPVVGGVALFSGQKFTGKIITPKQSLVMHLLMNKVNKHARVNYMWKNDGGDFPISAEVMNVKKKWSVNEALKKVTMTYDIEVEIDEFAHDHLAGKEVFESVQSFIQEKLQAEFEEVLHIFQEQKSDVLGVGRYIRSYHTSIYQDNWHEQFVKLKLEPKVKVSIVRTGILK